MKIVILNKSDATGGAAVVSRRLMEAMRCQGLDARMLVCEKLTDSPFVTLAASPSVIRWKFLLERLKIYIAIGFKKTNLFKIDTAQEGLPLWRQPMVKEADAILINWINQGMLSIKGLKKLLELQKPVIVTMHDMWDMTGICHHAGTCTHFRNQCGDCRLLDKLASPEDLSYKILKKKEKIFASAKLNKRLAFVAVSRWLEGKAKESRLLGERRLEVIPNTFTPLQVAPDKCVNPTSAESKIRILFGAARLDDPIKGLETLKAASLILSKLPEASTRIEIAVFGRVKDPAALEGFALPLVKLGILKGEREIARAYSESDIVVSASSYETLPGTLIEAQAYGCIPVSFNQGGQSDIIEDDETGFLVNYSEDERLRAERLAQGLEKALNVLADVGKKGEMIKKMRDSVVRKYSAQAITDRYVALINKMM